MGIGTQKRIEIFHPAEIRANRNILHGALVLVRAFGFVPRTTILLPLDASLRGRKVYVHIYAFEFLDYLSHWITSIATESTELI